MADVRLNLDGLKRLQQNAKKLDGEHRVPVTELFTPAFMRRCSRFHSFQDLLAASPVTIRSADDFRRLADADRDAFIRQNTSFRSWQEMVNAASIEWTKTRLFR